MSIYGDEVVGDGKKESAPGGGTFELGPEPEPKPADVSLVVPEYAAPAVDGPALMAPGGTAEPKIKLPWIIDAPLSTIGAMPVTVPRTTQDCMSKEARPFQVLMVLILVGSAATMYLWSGSPDDRGCAGWTLGRGRPWCVSHRHFSAFRGWSRIFLRSLYTKSRLK
jgi:hypothetical protein